jgi:hypothetical protein
LRKDASPDEDDMNQNSSLRSQSHWQIAEVAEKPCAISKLSVISAWAATIFAWVVVIALILAVAGFLTGEE